TDWEYWNSNLTDHAADSISDHFTSTEQGNYIFESDYPGWAATKTSYPPGEGLHESWFVIQAPDSPNQYEIRWYESDIGGLDPTVTVAITVNSPPTVSTQAASSIGGNSATLNGNITDIGDSSVTERGFEWGETSSYGSSWT
ncbi:unnamed protein product, partial [marine sediment metagenome]